MTRADRLSDLMSRLKRPGVDRAADLAAALDVTERTIYRDMAALREAGVPVAGTRGTGYRITATISLPPLHLTPEELEALQVGLAAVAQSGDAELGAAAARLADKLDAALPEDGIAARPTDAAARALRHLPVLRQAIRSRQKLLLDDHRVRPLRLDFWGRLWTLLSWDETAGVFRETPVDRITALTVLPSLFVDEPGRRAKDYDRS
ncbi:helix-turn-helix transcriptional regulator [Roseisalinus antarcticus]|uniref:Bifunctional biotin--[acetyl-CoA-carboxylase] synthetase/biotin operon repressor n=1 Tax=Roseisalinus antarcticus TaxID=254357 RepID=A0A1Y5STZ6_9RHOB|nr:HTH domain-containing protein [Roseisalinus antarcticus]SLN47830.1 bifunctional biotin--[acetyl-CoA-carboxylase] synthetase/biotin operon repressor [Roseisalinus antarcticus]